MVAFVRTHFVPLLVAATLAGMLVEAWSVLLAWGMPEFRGLLPYGGSEEAMYLIRTHQAMLEPFTSVTNGIVSGYALVGLQSAGIEQLIGSLLWWTGLPGPWVVFVLHVLVAPLMIPLFALLARRTGAREPLAFATALVMFWYFVYGRRLFHPGFSLPLTLATLLLLWRWFEHPTRWRAVLAGIPLGFSVGVYLWSWTFLWVTAATLVAMGFCDASLPQRRKLLGSVLPLGVTTGIAAAPAIHHLVMARLLPFFAEASVRAGLVHTRLPESPARSIATLAFAAAAWWLFRSRETRRSLAPLLAMTTSLAVMYNQQLVHGTVMSFSSHYIHYVSVALVLLLLAVYSRGIKTAPAIVTCAIALVVIALNFKDMGGRALAFLPPPPEAMRMQHLADALRTVENLSGTTVLSDVRTSDIVASYTSKDVAFTEFSGFLLVPDAEYAQRACLSELFAPEPVAYEQLVVHAEERLRVLRKQETQEQYDYSLRTARQLCDDVRKQPLDSLKSFGVDYILWNTAERPQWRLPRSGLRQMATGSGWSLWQVQP